MVLKDRYGNSVRCRGIFLYQEDSWSNHPMEMIQATFDEMMRSALRSIFLAVDLKDDSGLPVHDALTLAKCMASDSQDRRDLSGLVSCFLMYAMDNTSDHIFGGMTMEELFSRKCSRLSHMQESKTFPTFCTKAEAEVHWTFAQCFRSLWLQEKGKIQRYIKKFAVEYALVTRKKNVPTTIPQRKTGDSSFYYKYENDQGTAGNFIGFIEYRKNDTWRELKKLLSMCWIEDGLQPPGITIPSKASGPPLNMIASWKSWCGKTTNNGVTDPMVNYCTFPSVESQMGMQSLLLRQQLHPQYHRMEPNVLLTRGEAPYKSLQTGVETVVQNPNMGLTGEQEERHEESTTTRTLKDTTNTVVSTLTEKNLASFLVEQGTVDEANWTDDDTTVGVTTTTKKFGNGPAIGDNMENCEEIGDVCSVSPARAKTTRGDAASLSTEPPVEGAIKRPCMNDKEDEGDDDGSTDLSSLPTPPPVQTEWCADGAQEYTKKWIKAMKKKLSSERLERLRVCQLYCNIDLLDEKNAPGKGAAFYAVPSQWIEKGGVCPKCYLKKSEKGLANNRTRGAGMRSKRSRYNGPRG